MVNGPTEPNRVSHGEAGQPMDHPVQAGHAEGRYLKFLLGRVTARV